MLHLHLILLLNALHKYEGFLEINRPPADIKHQHVEKVSKNC